MSSSLSSEFFFLAPVLIVLATAGPLFWLVRWRRRRTVASKRAFWTSTIVVLVVSVGPALVEGLQRTSQTEAILTLLISLPVAIGGGWLAGFLAYSWPE